jgi:hypothetical protein
MAGDFTRTEEGIVKQLNYAFKLTSVDKSPAEQYLDGLSIREHISIRSMRIFSAIRRYEETGALTQSGRYLLVLHSNRTSDIFMLPEDISLGTGERCGSWIVYSDYFRRIIHMLAHGHVKHICIRENLPGEKHEGQHECRCQKTWERV